MEKIGVAIIGGTGYGAGELLRLLTQHPQVEVVSVVSQSLAGQSIAQAHPHLQGFYETRFDCEFSISTLSQYKNSIVFLALPHGISAKAVADLHPILTRHRTRLIDLSGDFRIRDQKISSEHYGDPGVTEEIRSSFCYGLPELYRTEIQRAQFVSNPGCLASACILAVLPLIAGKLSQVIAFDAKTGTSGAGRSPQESMHHPRRHASIEAYKILAHRHEPETSQVLKDAAGAEIELTFVPHLVPISRGIFVSAYGSLLHNHTSDDLVQKYKEFYAASPFVRVSTRSPDLGNVVGSNFCDITIVTRGRQFVAFSCLDNLVKGMAGVAIQNFNIMFGFPETLGLWSPAPGLI